jgi:predicted alpha/beta hydrolase
VNVPAEDDWRALFTLSYVGLEQHPWVWEEGFPDRFSDWGHQDFDDALNRCYAYLKERGELV